MLSSRETTDHNCYFHNCSVMCGVLPQAEAAVRAAVRPYRRPTAQEICYQRLQMAQQQAEQLAAAVRSASVQTPGLRTPGVRTPGVRTPGVRTPEVRTSSASPSSSLAGERKRVAHRPSLPAPSSSQPGMSIKSTSTFLLFCY